MLQDIENGSVKGSTATALDQHKDGGIYDEIGQEKVTPAQNGKPNGKAPSTEDVYAVPDKRKSNPPASPKLGMESYKKKFQKFHSYCYNCLHHPDQIALLN